MGQNADHLAVKVIVAHESPRKGLPLMCFRVDQKRGRTMGDTHLFSLSAVGTALWQLVTEFAVHADGHQTDTTIVAESPYHAGHQVVDGIIAPVEKEQAVTLRHLADNRALDLFLFGQAGFHRAVVMAALHVVIQLRILQPGQFRRLGEVRCPVSPEVLQRHKAAEVLCRRIQNGGIQRFPGRLLEHLFLL